MRRQATPEQKEKAQARREQFRSLCAKVADLDDGARQALAARMLATTVEGRTLSFGNQLLIALQRADVTLVGGFHQWKKAGRAVKKGESGLMIWCPTDRRGEREQIAPDGASEKVITNVDEKPGFILGYVFDVSQTETAEGGAA